MKVISFKVEDKIYHALKKKKMSFRVIFEPIAIQLARNNREGNRYTGSIPKNFDGLEGYVSELQMVTKKITNFLNFDGKEVKK